MYRKGKLVKAVLQKQYELLRKFDFLRRKTSENVVFYPSMVDFPRNQADDLTVF